MAEFVVPDWPAPPGVRALVTTRKGGASRAPWHEFNLGDHVGDDADAVAANRARLRALLPAEPRWLAQVHGTRCVDAARVEGRTEADASVTRERGVVCAVLTADCLPVLLCAADGSAAGIAHAGWRGLADGVIESAVAALGMPGGRLLAWLGPAIGPRAFEVGDEVRARFTEADAGAAAAFVARGEGKWLCDLYALARRRLHALGVERVAGGGECTVADAARFYSYRRDGVTGRMASLVWLE